MASQTATIEGYLGPESWQENEEEIKSVTGATERTERKRFF